MSSVDLRLGRWQEALADVERVDAVITDPPYGGRTHGGQRYRRVGVDRTEWSSNKEGRGIGYASLSGQDVADFVESWAPRCSGWFCVFSCHSLAPVWAKNLEAAGRYVFAPIACVQRGMNIRLAGDGPSNWTTWLTVSRPRSAPYSRWGTLPGAYVGNPFDAGQNTATATRKKSVVGSKPRWLMEAVVRDYTREGDLVCDPCAGGGTTLVAARNLGRRSVGAEMDPKTYEIAKKRLEQMSQPQMFVG